jgi:hypothetical protein
MSRTENEAGYRDGVDPDGTPAGYDPDLLDQPDYQAGLAEGRTARSEMDECETGSRMGIKRASEIRVDKPVTDPNRGGLIAKVVDEPRVAGDTVHLTLNDDSKLGEWAASYKVDEDLEVW